MDVSSGEQGFVNFAQDVTGLRENTGDKTREIQFPWEKRFQRSSLSLESVAPFESKAISRYFIGVDACEETRPGLIDQNYYYYY